MTAHPSSPRPQGETEGGSNAPNQAQQWSEGQPRAWLHARVRLMPRLLTQAPSWVRAWFDHAWAPMHAFAHQIDRLPVDLWVYLMGCPGGYVIIGTGESQYRTGPTILRQQRLENVAFVSVEDLAADNERPLAVMGHLIDHYLGCAGGSDGLWLSEGGGTRPGWREAGARLPALFALGYGVDPMAQSGVREYFAQSLALYCQDRQRLTVADPQICRWFKSTLWNRAFWQS